MGSVFCWTGWFRCDSETFSPDPMSEGYRWSLKKHEKWNGEEEAAALFSHRHVVSLMFTGPPGKRGRRGRNGEPGMYQCLFSREPQDGPRCNQAEAIIELQNRSN